MEITVQVPDQLASLIAPEGDLPRLLLEGFALEAYRSERLTVYQVAELLGLSRVGAEDFLGHHQIPLANLTEADLDKEAAVYAAARARYRC